MRACRAPSTSLRRVLGHWRTMTSSMCGPTAPEVSRLSPMNTTVRFCATSLNMVGTHTMRSKKRSCSLCTSLPTMTMRSARLRVSVSVDMTQPLVCTVADVAVLALAQRVIDDAARLVGERHHGAAAVDVGRHAAVERQLGRLDALGGGGDRLLERRLAAGDLRGRRRQARAGIRRRRGRRRSSRP